MVIFSIYLSHTHIYMYIYMVLTVSTALDHGRLVHRAHEVSLNVYVLVHIRKGLATGLGHQ